MTNEFQNFTLQSLRELQSDVSEMKSDVKHITKTLENNAETLALNTKDIAHHIYRTDLVESQIIVFNETITNVNSVMKDINDRLKPVEKQMLFSKWLSSLVVFVGGVSFAVLLVYLKDIVLFLGALL